MCNSAVQIDNKSIIPGKWARRDGPRYLPEPIHFEELLRHETHTSTRFFFFPRQRSDLLSVKMSLQALFMELIHLLDRIYSDRVSHCGRCSERFRAGFFFYILQERKGFHACE